MDQAKAQLSVAWAYRFSGHEVAAVEGFLAPLVRKNLEVTDDVVEIASVPLRIIRIVGEVPSSLELLHECVALLVQEGGPYYSPFFDLRIIDIHQIVALGDDIPLSIDGADAYLVAALEGGQVAVVDGFCCGRGPFWKEG